LESTPGRNIDRSHRRLLDRRARRFSAEATGTNLIYSFPHPRGELSVARNIPDRSGKISVQRHRSFLGRLIVTSSAASAVELIYFFASSRNFSVEISGSD
jgi:hypothetical protein